MLCSIFAQSAAQPRARPDAQRTVAARGRASGGEVAAQRRVSPREVAAATQPHGAEPEGPGAAAGATSPRSGGGAVRRNARARRRGEGGARPGRSPPAGGSASKLYPCYLTGIGRGYRRSSPARLFTSYPSRVLHLYTPNVTYVMYICYLRVTQRVPRGTVYTDVYTHPTPPTPRSPARAERKRPAEPEARGGGRAGGASASHKPRCRREAAGERRRGERERAQRSGAGEPGDPKGSWAQVAERPPAPARRRRRGARARSARGAHAYNLP